MRSLSIAFGSRKRTKTNLIFNFESLFIHSRRHYDSLVSFYEICIFESLSVYQCNSSSRSTDLIFDHRLISWSLDDKNIIEFIFYLKVLCSHFFRYVPISGLHRIFKRAGSVSYNSPHGRDRQSNEHYFRETRRFLFFVKFVSVSYLVKFNIDDDLALDVDDVWFWTSYIMTYLHLCRISIFILRVWSLYRNYAWKLSRLFVMEIV